MNWACKFGGADNALLAWGVRLDDQRTVYLEEQDLTTVKYYVRRRSGLTTQVKGDLRQSHQKLYGVYTDSDRQVQRTADIAASDVIADLGGHYRRAAYKVQGQMDEATALRVVQMALDEGSMPKVTTSFTVSDQIYTATGKPVSVDEIQAGGIVVVDDFRAREATLAGDDYRTEWASFQLVGVEIDEDAGEARLIPAGDRQEFEQFLTKLAAMKE